MTILAHRPRQHCGETRILPDETGGLSEYKKVTLILVSHMHKHLAINVKRKKLYVATWVGVKGYSSAILMRRHQAMANTVDVVEYVT